ncbi:MAG: TFIIB-type zinc ribbon-containing protein [Candidatus Nanoarchaeia archaeon]|jgi:transcription initiation factor TFIIB
MSLIELEDNYCPECNSKGYVKGDGNYVCHNCGLVLDKIIDLGADWRAFNKAEVDARSRTGPPKNPLSFDNDLSTIIDYHNKDANGKALTGGQLNKAYMLRKQHNRTRFNDYKGLNSLIALNFLNIISAKVGLNKIIMGDAVDIYNKSLSANIIRGRTIKGVALASLYCSCRINKSPYTIEDIINETNFAKKTVGELYRIIITELNLKMPIPKPIDYLSRFCSELKLPTKVELAASEIINLVTKKNFVTGKSPAGVCAAAIYRATREAGMGLSQKKIAKITKITEVTIRKRYKEINAI